MTALTNYFNYVISDTSLVIWKPEYREVTYHENQYFKQKLKMYEPLVYDTKNNFFIMRKNIC